MMRNGLPVLVLLLVAACAPCRCPEPGLLNMTDARQAVVDYHLDGRYEADAAKVAEAARAWVLARVEQGVSGRPAVVFDIHQTLLDVFSIEQEMQFGYFPAVWDRRVDEGNLPAIAPVAVLWRDLQARGVALFLVSNTKEKHRAATEANLRAVGVTGWERCILRPDDAPRELTAQAYKTATRAGIEAQGFVILASIGDQESDLAGGHAERGFKLPNYMWRLN